jgi:cell division transport system permease protein
MIEAMRRRLRFLRAGPAAAGDEELLVSLRRNMPLVPADTIASRALVTVIAIMTFLASLTAGGAILVSEASQGWDGSISNEMTIQIMPTAGRNLDADEASAAAIAKSVSGVADVQAYSGEEANRMLAPWLGSGLDLSELPIPRLIAIRLASGGRVDEDGLKRKLAASVPSAYLDDHRGWIERLTTMARTLVVFAAMLFVLVLTAMGLAVAFATRGAMAGNREIIDVLHFVGAEDRYVARQFQRHFLRLGLRGGFIGGLCAILAFLLSGGVSAMWAESAGGDQMEALFGSFSLGYFGYAAIALVAGGIAVLTGVVSKTIVFRHLRGLA